MMIEIMTPKTHKVKAVHYDVSGKVYDPELERLGRFFVDRMPEGECTFEAFIENPEHKWSIYGRSAKTFDKASGHPMKNKPTPELRCIHCGSDRVHPVTNKNTGEESFFCMDCEMEWGEMEQAGAEIVAKKGVKCSI